MASLSELIGWRDKLREARLSGVREVRDSNGESIRYATDAEMAKALEYAEGLIDAAHRGSPITTVRFSTSKGL